MPRNEALLLEPLRAEFQSLYPDLALAIEGKQPAFVADPRSYLQSFYLFAIEEVAVPAGIEEVALLLQSRFRNVLASAYGAKLEIVTLVDGAPGHVRMYFGVRNSGDRNQHLTLCRILEGALPGIRAELKANFKLQSLLTDKPYGGVLTGVPALKVDEVRQQFDLSTVIRSLYGERYTLVFLSRPVPTETMAAQYQQLLSMRDRCHRLARQTIAAASGGSRSEQESKTTTKTEGTSDSFGANINLNTAKGESNTLSGTLTGTVSGGLPFVGASLALGVTLAKTVFSSLGISGGANFARTKSNSTATARGTITGETEQWSLQFGGEQFNGAAMELERLAEQYLQRVQKGLNVGYWETSITFAVATEPGRDVLAGSLVGELSRPSSDLMPVRLYYDELTDERPLLVPQADPSSGIFEKTTCSYLTSEELSLVSAPPSETLPGFELRSMPPLSLSNPAGAEKDAFSIGPIADYGRPLDGSALLLSRADLARHTFICGLTGSGKTTTVKQLLRQAGVPFLVLESAKRDYRGLLGEENFKNLTIYTIGDARVAPLRLNPFYVQPGVSVLSHIDFLKAIFNATFSLYGPMPHILEKCLHVIYMKRGWNLTLSTHPFFKGIDGHFDESRYKHDEHLFCFPTLSDLIHEVDDYISHRMSYQGELRDNIRTALVTRLESLAVGAKGLMFDTHNVPDWGHLLAQPTVMELEALSDDDDKAFFLGLILTFIGEFRQHRNNSRPLAQEAELLDHLLVVEEAHRLLRRTEPERSSEMLGNPRAKAVEFFCNVIAEMRSLGQGLLVVEQIPTKLAPDVIKNSSNKLVHRLVSRDDQLLVASGLGLDDAHAGYLNRLPAGQALCFKEGMDRPVQVCVTRGAEPRRVVDDTVRHRYQRTHQRTLFGHLDLGELRAALGPEGRRFAERYLNSLLVASRDEFPDLQSDSVAALKLAGHSRLYRKLDEAAYREYLAAESMMLLGQYGPVYGFPDGLVFRLVQVVVDEAGVALKPLQDLLSRYWGATTFEVVSQRVKLPVRLKLEHVPASALDQRTILEMTQSEFVRLSQELAIKVSASLQDGSQR